MEGKEENKIVFRKNERDIFEIGNFLLKYFFGKKKISKKKKANFKAHPSDMTRHVHDSS